MLRNVSRIDRNWAKAFYAERWALKLRPQPLKKPSLSQKGIKPMGKPTKSAIGKSSLNTKKVLKDKACTILPPSDVYLEKVKLVIEFSYT